MRCCQISDCIYLELQGYNPKESSILRIAKSFKHLYFSPVYIIENWFEKKFLETYKSLFILLFQMFLSITKQIGIQDNKETKEYGKN